MDQMHYRPRSVSELIDGTIRIVRANFRTLFPLALVGYLPVIVLFAFVMTMATQEEPATGLLVAAGLLGFGFLFWFMLFDGAMVYAAAEAYVGRSTSAGNALRFAASRYGAVLGSNLAKYLAPGIPILIAVLLMALVPPFVGALFIIAGCVAAVLMFLRLALVPATVLHEGNGAMAGIRRSVELTRGGTGRIFLALLLVYLIWTAIYLVFYLAVVIAFMNNPVATVVIGQAAAALGYPIFASLTALLYFDFRIRREAYDIELMSQAMPSAGAGSAAI